MGLSLLLEAGDDLLAVGVIGSDGRRFGLDSQRGEHPAALEPFRRQPEDPFADRDGSGFGTTRQDDREAQRPQSRHPVADPNRNPEGIGDEAKGQIGGRG